MAQKRSAFAHGVACEIAALPDKARARVQNAIGRLAHGPKAARQHAPLGHFIPGNMVKRLAFFCKNPACVGAGLKSIAAR